MSTVGAVMPFSMNFALELAAGLESESSVCARYDVEPATLLAFFELPAFARVLSRLKIDLAREGVLIEVQAKLALEKLRIEAEKMAEDENLDAKDKLAAMEFVRKCSVGAKRERKSSPFRFKIVRSDGQTSVELKLADDYVDPLMGGNESETDESDPD